MNMERLTKRDKHGFAHYPYCFEKCDGDGTGIRCQTCDFEEKICDKLAEYEDLEEQGLLLKLPCKVGDVVYHENKYATIHTGIQSYQITNIMISQNKKGEWTKKYRAMFLLNGKIVDSQLNFSFDEIGKIVFFTEQEAQAELEKMKGGDE